MPRCLCSTNRSVLVAVIAALVFVVLIGQTCSRSTTSTSHSSGSGSGNRPKSIPIIVDSNRRQVTMASTSSSSSSLNVPNQRPPVAQRAFTSVAIDQLIEQTASKMRDRDLAAIFTNCLPNTLDTTVRYTANQCMPRNLTPPPPLLLPHQ
jgi:cell division protein FtsN